MRLIDSVKLQHEDASPWDFDGLFLKRDGTVKFCYEDRNSVVALSLEGEREVWYTAPEGEMLPGPFRWDNARPGYPPLLNSRGTVDNTSEVYYFQDYAISHKSEWSYVCKRGGEESGASRAMPGATPESNSTVTTSTSARQVRAGIFTF